MLEFLVKSKARRRMLLLLWGERAKGSVGELARLARVGFASAYRELHAMKELRLAKSDREHGKEVFSANEAHPQADALRSLALEHTKQFPTTDEKGREVRGRLEALGAPLMVSQKATQPVPLNETLVDGLRLAHTDAAVARSLPVLLWKFRDELDLDKLQHLALKAGEKRTLGLFLDLTASLGNDRRLSAYARKLRDARVSAQRDFFHGSLHPSTSAGLSQARRWGYRLNMDLASFEKLFREFAHA